MIATVRLLALTHLLLAAPLALSQEPAQPADSLKAIRHLEEHVGKLYTRVRPAVIGMRIDASDEGRIQGSGVIVTEDGYALTAAHCIPKPGTTLEVVLADGRVVKARNLGRYQPADAGLLKILDPGPFAFAPMGSADSLAPGQWAVVLGHPAGVPHAPLRLGLLLETAKAPDFLRSSCVVEPGDSGGPIFNLQGEVIGINSHISASLSDNFHVSINVYHQNWQALADGKTVGAGLMEPISRSPSIGFRLKFDPQGALVRRVEEKSLAEAAGIRQGDLLTHVNGVPLKDQRILREILSKNPDRLKFTAKRGEQSLSLELDLTRKDQEQEEKAP
ncbi:MAG TPA: S1C family serine protease [Planctomycetota bacterium]|nr:S1C family serine protease [Planctomycetota bacterium]